MVRQRVAAVLLVVLCGQALAARASWEADLRQMGYLFLHLSNINVINGLNLSREQAVKLYRISREIEAAAERPPSLRGRMHPELAKVRKTWLELRALLVKGENPSEELRNRVNAARVAESKVLRTTLRSEPLGATTRCANCHRAPRPAESLSGEPMSTTPANKKLVDLAHMEGLYGRRGLAKLVANSSRIQAILTDGQKSILGSFVCCLAPPEDLSDPMRAGQAEAGSKAIDLLRKVRQCPDRLWPLVRQRILERVDQITHAVSPAANADRKAVAREGVAKALDRARSASDVEFALEKEVLAKAAKAAIVPPQGDAPHKAAYFLMIPGASKVYAAYIKRLAKAKNGGTGGR